MDTGPAQVSITVYWAPGCSSCLRVKEYLGAHGVAYRSRNIQTDPTAITDLAAFGVRRVPVVTAGDRWVDGQALSEVAQLCGIEFKAHAELTVDRLAPRLLKILKEAERTVSQFDPAILVDQIPDGNRRYADLSFHVFSVAEIFLDHAAGQPATFSSYLRVPQADQASREQLMNYAIGVRLRLSDWFDENLKHYQWDAAADVYYGEQSHHQFLERTTWHAGQHLRQLLWRLDREHGSRRLADAQPLFDGLPMPHAVWHSEAE